MRVSRLMTSMLFGAVLTTLAATGSWAADQTWTGAISDKMCGADHRKMGNKLSDKECTLACTKNGAPFVLVISGKVYELAGHEADLKAHAGETVRLTGELKGASIRVSKVEGVQP